MMKNVTEFDKSVVVCLKLSFKRVFRNVDGKRTIRPKQSEETNQHFARPNALAPAKSLECRRGKRERRSLAKSDRIFAGIERRPHSGRRRMPGLEQSNRAKKVERERRLLELVN